MMGHKICFNGKIRKIVLKSMLPLLIWSFVKFKWQLRQVAYNDRASENMEVLPICLPVLSTDPVLYTKWLSTENSAVSTTSITR